MLVRSSCAFSGLADKCIDNNPPEKCEEKWENSTTSEARTRTNDAGNMTSVAPEIRRRAG